MIRLYYINLLTIEPLWINAINHILLILVTVQQARGDHEVFRCRIIYLLVYAHK